MKFYIYSPLLFLTLFSCNIAIEKDKSNETETNENTETSFQKSKVDNSLCECNEQTTDNYDCDTITLSNNAILYWKINCDLVEYCFEKNSKITTIYSNQYYDHRLGMSFKKEYDDYLYFVNQVISGCCTPPELVFLDKNNASEINKISSDNFIYANSEKDYIIYFKDTTLTSVTYHNLKTNKKSLTNIGNIMEKSINNNSINHVTDLLNIETNKEKVKLEVQIDSNTTQKFKLQL